jgi:hypothetical protein
MCYVLRLFFPLKTVRQLNTTLYPLFDKPLFITQMTITMRDAYYNTIILFWGFALLYSLYQMMDYVDPNTFAYDVIYLGCLIGFEIIVIFCFIGAYTIVLDLIDCVCRTNQM